MTDRIPITAGEALAHRHGYDQVIIYARRVGAPGLEWVTTYGKTKEHCAAAARIGDVLRGHVVEPLEAANAARLLAEQRFAELNRGFGEALADVALERRRQVEGEGWTAEHDDGHVDGEIGRAAAAYALSAMKLYQIPLDLARDMKRTIAAIWPWDASDFKPSGKPDAIRRSLVKAAALIIAEIERLDRAAARKAGRS